MFELIRREHARVALVVPNANIELETIRWQYGGDVSVESNANMLVELFSNPDAEIAEAISTNLIGKLPARMNTDDYNPFEDNQLASELTAAFAGSTDTGGEQAGDAETMAPTMAELSFGFTLDEDYERAMDDGTRLQFAAGSRMTIESATKGAFDPTSTDEFKLDGIALDCDGDVYVKFLGGDVSPIQIKRITIEPGGDVVFDYDLVTETATDILRVLATAIALEAGGGEAARQLDRPRRPSRHRALRAKIDKTLDEQGAPMVRQLLADNACAFPGLDLLKAPDID